MRHPHRADYELQWCFLRRLGLVADTKLSGLRVARELDRIIEERGKPRMIVSDNGSEFTSTAIQWADRAKVEWHSPLFA